MTIKCADDLLNKLVRVSDKKAYDKFIEKCLEFGICWSCNKPANTFNPQSKYVTFIYGWDGKRLYTANSLDGRSILTLQDFEDDIVEQPESTHETSSDKVVEFIEVKYNSLLEALQAHNDECLYNEGGIALDDFIIARSYTEYGTLTFYKKLVTTRKELFIEKCFSVEDKCSSSHHNIYSAIYDEVVLPMLEGK